ncbi:Toluene efflux pump periplasmic linker protein TtgD precursor [Marinomonas aquimarina]|uniref:Toluene efflux pump periplasmic linker protein TtgD n=1 Tax=Marinomonas aquimarina TaxID=295068 RepID=A0A1A8T1U4_9GAMM|nr:efflux RND transporter periplasmic adaptor subunit [Marinomonas aquimarina]SBS25651.1 Toluene efflux pump periplasmic linker protein TtgD precursor [Marinomonas aquimarina]
MVRPFKGLTPLLLALTTTGVLLGCSTDEQIETTEAVIRPVKLYTIDATDIVSIRHFPAELKASDEADLAFRVGGQVTQLNVKEGQRVERGQLLASLDPTDYALQVELSEANYKLAKAQFDRIKTMLAKNATTQAQFDEAKATLDQTENALETAKNQLGYSELRAPYDGVIASLSIDNYEYVGATQTILHIQNIEQMDVEFQIPERLVANIQKVALQYHPQVSIDAVPSQVFEAAYKEHRTSPDVTTKSYDATLSLLNTEDTPINLLPGMTATVDLDISQISGKPTHITVPIEAVMRRQTSTGDSQSVVWVFNPEQGSVTPREVTLGDMTQNSIEILTGLAPGEQVVAAGVHDLTPDLKVRPWTRERGI